MARRVRAQETSGLAFKSMQVAARHRAHVVLGIIVIGEVKVGTRPGRRPPKQTPHMRRANGFVSLQSRDAHVGTPAGESPFENLRHQGPWRNFCISDLHRFTGEQSQFLEFAKQSEGPA